MQLSFGLLWQLLLKTKKKEEMIENICSFYHTIDNIPHNFERVNKIKGSVDKITVNTSQFEQKIRENFVRIT